jgi:hypothetical protein
MESAISLMTAVSLGLTYTALADNYKDLAAQGCRWVTVNGPYACATEQDVQRMVAHRTDATELQVVENIQCYYLIPETVVQVMKDDPAKGMSQIRLAGITKPLWAYTRFLSEHPILDTYGTIETPEEVASCQRRTQQSSRSLPIVRQLGLGRTELRNSKISYGIPFDTLYV